MEKYDDLIVSLIKKHRKYPEYELILDDIVAEVKNKSASVLNSVPNEDVVESYLTKIVATAMVTVPKRAGFAKPRETVMPDFSANIQHKQITDSDAVNDDQLLIQELSDDENVENISEDSVIEPENFEENIDESVVQDDLTEELELETENSANEKPTVSEQEPALELTSETKPETETELNIEDNSEFMSEPQQELELTDESSENILEEDSEPLELMTDIDIENSEESVTTIPDLNNEKTDVDKDLVDKMINGVTQEEELVSDLSEELDVDIQNELLPEGDFSLEIEESELEQAEDIEDSEFAENSEPAKTGPSFDRFSFEPEKENLDEESCLKDLEEYQGKNPQKRITDICLLKYKENKTVDEICDELELTSDEVLETLEEVIDLVKG